MMQISVTCSGPGGTVGHTTAAASSLDAHEALFMTKARSTELRRIAKVRHLPRASPTRCLTWLALLASLHAQIAQTCAVWTPPLPQGMSREKLNTLLEHLWGHSLAETEGKASRGR